METHNEYCLQVPHQRKGCYCWEGDQRMFYEARVKRLQAENHDLRIRVFTLLKKLEEK